MPQDILFGVPSPQVDEDLNLDPEDYVTRLRQQLERTQELA